jgi:hypothetical protein
MNLLLNVKKKRSWRLSDNVLLLRKKNVSKKNSSADKKLSASVKCSARESVQPVQQMPRRLPLDRLLRRED